MGNVSLLGPIWWRSCIAVGHTGRSEIDLQALVVIRIEIIFLWFLSRLLHYRWPV